ncbi:MAG TPA: carbon-nitrogen hydrolase family protein, partial [Candidatus Eremiobacteraceae bacterium]|nr:carbon-nitrogen hydrolase family protein [Candidatus Eremiobacteraceae bacterium]
MRRITLRVACVQLRARPLPESAAALDDVVRGIRMAAARGAHIAVFPECSYPGYVLLRKDPYRSHDQPEAALRAVRRVAAREGVAVALGIARYDGGGRLRNEAVFIDRRGAEVARYAKFFLWNFDGAWFERGRTVEPFETEFGRLGMMICADGRMPEIA